MQAIEISFSSDNMGTLRSQRHSFLIAPVSVHVHVREPSGDDERSYIRDFYRILLCCGYPRSSRELSGNLYASNEKFLP